MVEVIFANRKDGFKEYPSVMEDLDLVEEGDQFTHLLTLEDEFNTEDGLSELSHYFCPYIGSWYTQPKK